MTPPSNWGRLADGLCKVAHHRASRMRHGPPPCQAYEPRAHATLAWRGARAPKEERPRRLRERDPIFTGILAETGHQTQDARFKTVELLTVRTGWGPPPGAIQQAGAYRLVHPPDSLRGRDGFADKLCPVAVPNLSLLSKAMPHNPLC